MALKGNLNDFSLPDVFQLIQLSRKTGVLRISRGGSEGTIWFREGEVFFATSDWRHELLGQRLVGEGRITSNALARALAVRQAEPPGGRRLGTILVDEGYLTYSTLETFVQEQIQDTIFDLMRWDDGAFFFEPLEDVPADEDIGLSVSVENIVMEGSRRLEEWNRIRRKIPSMDMVFRMSTVPGQGAYEISLKPSEWRLLLALDGSRTVAELAEASGRTDFEAARSLYGLYSAGLLELGDEESVERARGERERRGERLAGLRARTPGAKTRPAPAAPSEPPAEARRPARPPREPGEAADEPAFLTTPASASPTDVAVFDELIGASIGRPTQAPPSGEPVSAEYEAGLPEEPQPEPGPELPPEPEPVAMPEPEPEPRPEPVPEPEPVSEPEPEPVLAGEPEAVPGIELQAPSVTPTAVEPTIPASAVSPAAEAAEEYALPAEEEPPLPPYVLSDLLAAPPAEEAPVETAPQAEPAPQPQPEAVAEPEPEPQPEAVAEPEREPQPEAVAEPEPEPQPEAVAEPEREPQPQPEPVIEPGPGLEAVVGPEPAPAVGSMPEAPFIPAPAAEPAPPAAQPAARAEPGASARAIADLPDELFGDDMGFGDAGVLGAELTALTGAERTGRRPAPSAASVPPVQAGPETRIRRDTRVDRATVERIIEGLENL